MLKNDSTDLISKRRSLAIASGRALLESLEHRTLFSTFTVTNTLDDGSAGSLRWAVNQANLNTGDDSINFDSTVFSAPKTITLGGTQLELTDTSGATTITAPAGGVTVSGGALSRVLQVDNLVTASVSGVTVTGGKSSSGGGIHNYGTLTLTNCTISGNKANDGGGISTGGYYNQVGSTSLVNCTVSGNSGLGSIEAYFGSTTLTNTISDTIFGTVSGTHNLITVDSGGLANGVDGNIVVGDKMLKLAPLGVYGGTGETMPILPGSPAIDAGISGPGIPTTDARGLSRVGPTDIGAFESQGFTFAIVPGSTPQSANIGTAFSKPLALSVTPNNPVEPVNGATFNFVANPATNGATAIFVGSSAAVVTGGMLSVAVAPSNALGHYTVAPVIPGFSGSFTLTNTGSVYSSPMTVNTTSDAVVPGAGLLSLREAIAFADVSSLPNSNITFDTKVFKTAQTIKLTNGQLELSNPTGTTTITAPSKGLTLDAGGLSRVYMVDAAATASLSGFTIINGNATLSGGGVANYGKVALTNCTISGNTNEFGSGGGVANSGTATLNNCTLKGNSSYASGGGLFNDGTVAMTQCTVSGNTSTVFGGGGVASTGPLTMNNCTVNHNSAYDDGGGVLVGGAGALTNCTISGNSVTGTYGAGGGVANTYGTLTMVNSIVSGNAAPQGGGLLTFDGTTTSTGCTINGNTANTGDGGGVLTEASTTSMTRCTVSGNTAISGGGVDSKGVLFFTITQYGYTAAPVDGDTLMTSCIVSCNSAKGSGDDGVGGGVLNDANGNTTLTNCSVTGNSATNSGGGFFSQGNAPSTNYGGYTNYAAATLTNCIVSGNTATARGGGLGNAAFSNTTITSSNIFANSASVGGGGISISGGTATIYKSLVTFNSVEAESGDTATGGGVDCEGGILYMAKCTVVLNQAIGGNATNSTNAGNAYGGGIYVASGGTAEVTSSTITLNQAVGGRGSRCGSNGGNGKGVGGGVFNLGTFTYDLQSLIVLNFASTSSNNIGA